MSNHPLYQRYLNGVTVADVVGDPAVVAARVRAARPRGFRTAMMHDVNLRPPLDDQPARRQDVRLRAAIALAEALQRPLNAGFSELVPDGVAGACHVIDIGIMEE